MSGGVLLAVYALAVARVTGLVVSDSITEGLRDAIMIRLDRWGGGGRRAGRGRVVGPFLAELLGCPWCVSVWLGMIAAPLVWYWGMSPVMLIPALALAFSQVTGMIHGIGR